MFKEARENTGEDWAEKVASEIASLLGLRTHYAELASWNGKRGCAVKSFLLSDQDVLVHGNELLGGHVTDYDQNKQRQQADHTVENIVAAIEHLFPEDKSRRDAAIGMVGYLSFDALIGNTDRHHQNWGVLQQRGMDDSRPPKVTLRLAPTFDHASSLGRELTDDARDRHLREGTVEKYIRRGRGGVFLNSQQRHGLSPTALAELLSQRYPRLFGPWRQRIAALSVDAVNDLMQRIPQDRISLSGRRFAIELVSQNKKLLEGYL